jgi:hypothetical protein
MIKCGNINISYGLSSPLSLLAWTVFIHTTRATWLHLSFYTLGCLSEEHVVRVGMLVS